MKKIIALIMTVVFLLTFLGALTVTAVGEEYPTRVIANIDSEATHQSKDMIMVSWKNPASANITSAIVSPAGTTTEVAVGGDIVHIDKFGGTGSGEVCLYVIWGGNTSKTEEYDVVITANGVTTSTRVTEINPLPMRAAVGGTAAAWYGEFRTSEGIIIPGTSYLLSNRFDTAAGGMPVALSMAFDPNVKYSGGGSLRLTSNMGKAPNGDDGVGNRYITLKFNSGNLIPNDDYVLWVTAKATEGKSIFLTAPGTTNNQQLTIVSNQTENDGWLRSGFAFKADSSNPNITISFQGSAEMWFDEISITTGADHSTNLCPEWNFGAYVTTAPTNIMANVDEANGRAIFSWRNPKNEKISASEIYEVGGLTPIAGSARDIGTASEKMNTLLIEDYSPAKNYEVRLNFGGDYQEKAPVTLISNRFIDYAQGGEGLTATYDQNPALRGGYNLQGWELFYVDQYYNDPTAPATVGVFIDNNEKHSGNSSMHIVSNMEGIVGNRYWDIFMRDIIYEVGQSYTFSAWVKSKNLLHTFARIPSLSANTVPYGFPDTWTKITQTFTATGGTIDDFRITFNSSGELWIDDVEVRKDGTGPNLALQGGFEYEVDNVQIDANNLITWDYPAGHQFEEITIWKQGEASPVGAVAAPATSYQLTNAVVGDAYLVRAKFGGTYYSSGKTVYATGTSKPDFDKVTFTGVEFNKEGIDSTIIASDITDMTSGYIMAKTTAKNNLTADTNVCFMIVLYNGGILENISYINKTVSPSDSGEAPEELRVVIEVPESQTANYSIKAFAWEGLTGMKPLGEAGILE